MRVAFFVGGFPKTSETFVVNAARAVLDAGHEVTIHEMDPVVRAGEHLPPAIEAEGLDRIRVTARPPLKGADQPAALLRAIASLPKHGTGALRLLSPTRLSEARDAARVLFDAEATPVGAAYDVLHCHFATLAPRVARLRRAGVVSGKLLVHCRGFDVSVVLPQRRAYARRLFAEADGVIANSEHFREAAIRLGASRDNSTVVPSGLDLSRFVLRAGERRAGPIRLLTVGRLVEKKGLSDLLSAFANLSVAAELMIVGDGPLRSALQEQARALSIDRRVHFAGSLPHDQVAAALMNADIFAAPSVTAGNGDQDAGTNTLKEAMATGLPVVATHHGGIPELVRDGIEGLLVPERDPRALSEAIATLAKDAGRRTAMGQAGRKRVELGFSQTLSSAKLLAVYDALRVAAPLSSLDEK